MRVGAARDLRDGEQRMLGVRKPSGVRHQPELHGRGRGGDVHVQHGLGLRRSRQRLRKRNDPGDLFERCAELHLSVGDHDVRQRRLQCRSVLRDRIPASLQFGLWDHLVQRRLQQHRRGWKLLQLRLWHDSMQWGV